MITRPAIFKWRQTEPSIILCAVRWYLRYSRSLRDVEELLEERCLNVDHTTVWRWVQYYGPELEQRLRPHLQPTNKSWRVDETYSTREGSLVLPVSGHRFRGCHHRFLAVSVP
jgi:IS6 family transposase